MRRAGLVALTACGLAFVAETHAQVSFAIPGDPRFAPHPAWRSSLVDISRDMLGFADERTVYTRTGTITTCIDGVRAPVLVLDTARTGVPDSMGAPATPWMQGVDASGRLLALAVSPTGWMYLFRGDCTHPATLVASLASWRNPIAGEPLQFWGAEAGFAVARDGEMCVSRSRAGVVCVREASGALEVTRFIDHATLTRAAGANPEVFLQGAWRGVAGPWHNVEWDARGLSFAPSGSLFLSLVSAGARPFGPSPASLPTVGWVLEAPRGEAPFAHAGPYGTNTLGGFFPGLALVYEPSLDAMLMVGAGGGEAHTWSPGPGGLLTAWNGQGVLVVPIGRRPGVGYIDLSSQLYASAGEFTLDLLQIDEPRGLRFYRDIMALNTPMGTFWGLPAWHRQARGCSRSLCLEEFGFRAHQLLIDPEGVDLDQDGLVAAEERALGTSDFLLDSDGGGSQDGTEVRLGFNPANPGDDRHGRVAQRVTFSPLIRSRLDPARRPASASQWRHPYCRGTGRNGRSGIECIASNGAIVASTTFPSERVESEWEVPPSGEFLVISGRVDEPATMLRFSDSQALPYAPAASVAGMYGRVLPYDERSAFFVDVSSPSGALRLRALRTGQAPRTVFDVNEITQRTQPESLPLHGRVGSSATVLGWYPSMRRLLTYVPTGIGSFTVGVSLDDPPVLLQRSRAVAGFTSAIDFISGPLLEGGAAFQVPSRALALSSGEFMWISPTENPLVQVTDLRDETLGRQPVDYIYTASSVTGHRAVWGDTVIGMQFCAPQPCRDQGPLEFVRVPDRPRPGDVLVFVFVPGGAVAGVYPNEWQLMRVGPRGGVDTLLHGRSELAVSAMDVSPDARHLCMLDETAGRLYEFLFGVDGGGATLTASFDIAARGYSDCRYDRNGTLHLLGNLPPHRTTLDRAGRALTPEVASPVAGFLARDRAGDVVVLDNDGWRTRGATLGVDGEPIQVLQGLTLRVGAFPAGHQILGRVITDARGTRTAFPTLPELIRDDLRGPYASRREDFFRAYASGLDQARWHVLQRPDGLILALPSFVPAVAPGPVRDAESHLLAIDPYTGKVNEMTSFPFGTTGLPTAMALIPGGPAVDPWTGEAVYPGAIPEVPGGTAVGAGRTETPASTTLTPSRGSDPTPVSSCTARPGAATKASAALLLFALVALRRRRHGPAAPAGHGGGSYRS